MFELVKAPRGLLELFRLRTNGRQPDTFANVVAPTVDVTDFYGIDLAVCGASNTAAQALPTSNVQTLAQPVRLLALSAELTIGAAAGTRLAGRTGVRFNTSEAIVWLSAFSFQGTIAAGSAHVAGGWIPGGLILPQGAQLFVGFEGDNAGADHVVSARTLWQTLTFTS